jgi:hypothetical protein
MMMKRFFGFSLLLLPFFLMGGVGLWAQVAGAGGDAGAGVLGVCGEGWISHILTHTQKEEGGRREAPCARFSSLS